MALRAAPPPPPPPDPLPVTEPDPSLGDALTNPLLGTPPAGDEPDLLGTGIVSGQGNQGSSNTAHMGGHAGTGADFLSLPRQLKAGGFGSKPQ